jgi:choice-of-anchor B domain-containing protein
MRKSIITLMFMALAVCVVAQAAKNMSLLGTYSNFTGGLADVAGYAAPGGTEYAIVGHENGVAIISLANPSNPTLTQNLPGPTTIWREIDIYQNYAYIVNEESDGLRIVNLSNLPGAVTYKDTVINNMNTGHTLYITGNRLYVYGADIDGGGVSIFSLADPWRPVHIGFYDTRYVHDAYVRNNIAYLSEIYQGFMTMVDLSNPTNPVTLGQISTPDNFTHNTWLNDAGNICFTTDEVDAAWVAAYDITDPSNITEVDRYRSSLSNGLAIPHNVKVLNDFIVTAYYKDGVNIVDCARPHNLIETGYYDTNPQNGGGFDGVWGLDCYLPSGNIIAADMSEGLFVLGPTYVRACYLEGIVTDAVTTNPILNANVTIQTTPANDLTDAAGSYATGLADAGTYQVLYTAFGYRDSTITTTLSNGQLVMQNVPLQPLARYTLTVNVVEQGTGNPIPGAKVQFKEVNGGTVSPYVANGSGQVVDPNFVPATYQVLAGKWGWNTNLVTYTGSGSNANLTIQLPKGYADEFALDLGWTVTGSSNTGVWEIADPVGTFDNFNTIYNPENDMTNDIGVECYVTGNGGGAIGDDDVDGGNAILTSPIMDLSGYTEPIVRYYRWFANGGGQGGPINDTLRIELDNGINTAVIKRVSGMHNIWTLDTMVISNFISPTAKHAHPFHCGGRQPWPRGGSRCGSFQCGGFGTNKQPSAGDCPGSCPHCGPQPDERPRNGGV